MRRVLLDEVLQAARVIEPLERAEQTRYLADWLYLAHSADKFRKRTGRAHAQWGNGSLADVLPQRAGFGATDLGRDSFCRALTVALAALMVHRSARPG